MTSTGDDALLRIALVLGAGGSVGGRFIDGALSQLRKDTSFDWMSSSRILGTSAGSFRSAYAENGAQPPPTRAVASFDNQADWEPKLIDRPATAVRRGAGRLLARFAPTARAEADYDVPGAPHHDQAYAVTVSMTSRQRVVHRLADAPDPRRIVLASSAVPFAVGPIALDGEHHIDGAVLSPNSADLIDPADFAALVVVAPMLPRLSRSPVHVTHRAQLRHELRGWTRVSKPLLVITPEHKLKGASADEAKERGRAAVRRTLVTASRLGSNSPFSI